MSQESIVALVVAGIGVCFLGGSVLCVSILLSIVATGVSLWKQLQPNRSEFASSAALKNLNDLSDERYRSNRAEIMENRAHADAKFNTVFNKLDTVTEGINKVNVEFARAFPERPRKP